MKANNEFWSAENWRKRLFTALKVVGILVLTTNLIVIMLEVILTGTTLIFSDDKSSFALSIGTVWGWTFYSVYYGLPLHLVNAFFMDWCDRMYPWEKYMRKRAIFGFIGQIVITIVSIILLNIILWVIIENQSWSTVWDEENRGYYVIAIIITITISLFFHAIYFFREIEKKNFRLERLEREKLESELTNLRAHLDPHFLFNSLNVLSGLIDEDTEEAQHFLASLSKMYRMLLEKQQQHFSTLFDELEIAKTYIALYQTRFEKAIVLKIDVPAQLQGDMIPSLSLQLLIENAIKHNAFDQDHPMTIQIGCNKNTLLVSNPTRPKKDQPTGTGQGLKNIENRYALLGIHAFGIRNEHGIFEVQLPLIKEIPIKTKI